MPGPTGVELLGHLAVSRGFLTPERLRQALELHGRDGKRERLGDLLVRQGWITPAQLQALLAEQASRAAGKEPSPGLAEAEDALLTVERALPLTPIGKTPVSKKDAAEVEAEQQRARAAAAARVKEIEAKQKKRMQAGREHDPMMRAAAEEEDRVLDFELPGSDEPFEIENQGVTRAIDSAEPGAPAPQPPARVPAKAPAATAVRPPAPRAPVVAPVAPPPAAAPYDPDAVLSTPGGRMIADLVGAAARATASDLHLHPGHPLMIRQHGRIVTGQGAPLKPESLAAALQDILSPEEREVFAHRGELETIFAVPGLARTRVTMLRCAEGPSAIFRLIPAAIPTLAALGLPGMLARFLTIPQGLVLLAGPSGCGKSWTLAAMVDILNTERKEHIVCIERPIEFLHPSKRCVVSQREVPAHATSVSRAVMSALHEDPDVLVIGELDEAETVRLAITAAETGRLVLATISASSSVRAVTRMIGMFPSEQQAQVSTMLADGLRAVVAQRLVPMADGVRRLAICEVLELDAEAAERVHAGRAVDLMPGASFDQGLTAAVRQGSVTREEARRHADRPEPFG